MILVTMPNEMQNPRFAHPRSGAHAVSVLVVILLIILIAFFARPKVARGQFASEVPGGMTQPVDAYGNAQPIHPERRPLEIFSNEVQREMLRAYQTTGRRVNQRGPENRFALPSDQFMMAMAGRQRPTLRLPGVWQARPSLLGLRESERKAAFRSYGGFGDRRQRNELGDTQAALTRKRSLIAATGSTAPLERSRLLRGGPGSFQFPAIPSSAAPPSAIAIRPADPQDAVETPAQDLNRFLTAESDVLKDRAVAEGWSQFRANDFRAAVRSFESATVLDDKDFEARLGAVASYLSLGSFRAAYAAMAVLARRDANLFRHDVSILGRFGDPMVAQQLKLQVMGAAEAADQSPEMSALAIFVLWYMDGKEDALRAARILASRPGGQFVAQWPQQMREALNQQSAP